MNLDQLLAEAPSAPEVVEAIAELTSPKARTRELGTGPVPTPIRGFVAEWLDADVEGWFPAEPDQASARARAADGFPELVVHVDA